MLGEGQSALCQRTPITPSIMGTVPFRGALPPGGDDDGVGSVSNSSSDLDVPHCCSPTRQTHACFEAQRSLGAPAFRIDPPHTPLLLKKRPHVGALPGSNSGSAALQISPFSVQKRPQPSEVPFSNEKGGFCVFSVCLQVDGTPLQYSGKKLH